MLCFLLAHIAAFAVASAKSEVVPSESVSQNCSSHPINADVLTQLRTDCYCMQSIVVAEGHAAQLFVANRETYCGQLNEDERELAEITGGVSTLLNFCTASARSFSVAAGTYRIAVSHTRIPIQISVTYHNTSLGCNDAVSPSLIDIPLTFDPTKHKCSLILPGLTILEIKSIRSRAKENSQNRRNCVRVRMGKHMYNLNLHWDHVCEIPSHALYEYKLGCGAVVMDASSLAIERVEFVLKPMDDLKAVIAPLMCSNEDNGTPTGAHH